MFLSIFVLTVGLTACGGGGGVGGPSSNGNDATLPTMISITPAPGATAVSTDSKITIKFTKAIQAASVTSATLLVTNGSTAISGSYAVTGDTVVFDPTADLPVSATINVQLTPSIKDTAGNALIATISSSFTTAATVTSDLTPPTVVSITPANAATGVSVSTTITVTFSENVQALASGNFTVTANNVAVPGVIATTGTTSTFTPNAVFLGSAAINVNISGVKDTTGNTLASNYASTFTTAASGSADTTPPFVSSTAPANNAVAVTVNSVIITMSEAVQANIGTATISLGSTIVSSAVVYNGANITITPNASFLANTTYTVNISGQKDTAGNTMATSVSYNFTTSTWVSPLAIANNTFVFSSATAGQATWNNATGNVIVNSLPTNRWDIQLRRANVPVEAGNTFRVSFTCTGGHLIMVLFKKNSANYDEYAKQQVVCDGAQSVNLIPTQSDVAGRIEFQFGLPAASYPASFSINNVIITKIN
jgi:hypothetical protein